MAEGKFRITPLPTFVGEAYEKKRTGKKLAAKRLMDPRYKGAKLQGATSTKRLTWRRTLTIFGTGEVAWKVH
jgi:hypothetical protein